MKWSTDTSGDLDQHWMVTGRRGDQPVPGTVLARWRWYKRGARRDRLRYAAMEVLAIIASAAIPVAAAGHFAAPVIAGLGAVALVATALRTTFSLHENWVEHSQVGYAIERESALYFAAAPPYDTADAAQRLVVRIETLAEQGGQRWASRRMSLEHPQQPNANPREPVTPSASE
jgi:hypothetical protein